MEADLTPITKISMANDGTVFVERRKCGRRRVLKGARLEFNRGFGAMEGVVRNLSDGGARIVFGETTGVPQHFDLLIAGENEAKPARVCWRSVDAVGVAFE